MTPAFDLVAPLRAALAVAVLTLPLGGCVLFDTFYAGPFPCDDDTNCPSSSKCVNAECTLGAGAPCDTDGECDDGEYCNTTDKVCGDGNVFDDDFVVENQLDLDDLAFYHRVNGVVLVGPDSTSDSTPVDRGLTTLALPRLVRAAGIHIINQRSLTEVSLPALEFHGNFGIRVEGNDVLEGLSFPALVDADSITIQENEALTEIRMDALPRLSGFGGGILIVVTNPALQLISAPAMDSARNINLGNVGTEGGPAFTVNFPSLETVDFLAITSAPSLETLSFDRLTALEGNGLFINNDALTSLSATSLTTVEGDFTVANHAVLTTLTVPALGSVGGDLDISDNDLLPQCDMESTFSAVTVGGDVDITNNAPCP